MGAGRILLIEDDAKIVRALLPALEVSGHEVTRAATGTAALHHLSQGAWEAVILDLGLPDMDGTTILRSVRQTSEVPVIVISARHSYRDRAECQDAGATSFLAKPFATPELVACLSAALGRNGASRH